MASWMVHLRIAERLYENIENLDKTAFILGNIAPDSGVPNEDWSVFTPPGTVTHFRTDPNRRTFIDIDKYVSDYFTEDKVSGYDKRQYSFFLGYLTHLLTDVEWTRAAHDDWHCDEKDAERLGIPYNKLVWTHKGDWYDLDFKYLRDHPDFDAFLTYESASDEDIDNDLMEEFPKDAFQNRRGYICGYYRSHEHGDLDRDYQYLSQKNYDGFVEDASALVLNKLQHFL